MIPTTTASRMHDRPVASEQRQHTGRCINHHFERGTSIMNKVTALFIVLLLAAVFQPSAAQRRTFGIGLIVGEPTGISAKLWTSQETAFDFGLGWSVDGGRAGQNNNDYYYTGGSRVHFHMDYLWHSFDAIRASGQFPLHYGIGGRLNSGDGYSSTISLRGVFGISWLPRDTPIDVFLELAPTLRLTNSSGLYIGAGLGARYYL